MNYNNIRIEIMCVCDRNKLMYLLLVEDSGLNPGEVGDGIDLIDGSFEQSLR